MSVLEETMARYAAARAKMQEAGQAPKAVVKSGGSSSGMGFSSPDNFRTLDSVKSLPRGRAANHARSASRHASGARSAASVSLATTSLTVRSAAQVGQDRAFNFTAYAPPAPPLVVNLEPLDHGLGKEGIGTSVEKVWRKQLRGTIPEAAKGDPVANNSLSKNGFQTPSTPGMFSQMPERLGRWRDDFAGQVDSNGTFTSAMGPTKGMWVPEALVRQRDKQIRAHEAKLAADEKKKEAENKRIQEQERIRREEERAIAMEEARANAEAREAAEQAELERAAKAKKDAAKKNKKVVPSCLRRASMAPGSAAAAAAAAAASMGAGGD